MLCYNLSFGQKTYTIDAHIPESANSLIILKGNTIYGDTLVTSAIADSQGFFNLKYSCDKPCAALLEVTGQKSVILLLNKENFELYWNNVDDYESLKFINSPENEAFIEGLKLYQQTEGKRAGLHYLMPYYDQEPKGQRFLYKELEKQNKAMEKFLKTLPKDMYAKYYLKIRKLLSDMPITANSHIERITEHQNDFNGIDFASENLIRSGLYKDLLESYFTLLESYGDNQYSHMNTSIDAIITSLQAKPELLQEVTRNLFFFLEKRSLFPAAEYLALKMLSDGSCHLEQRVSDVFEQYRKMANGQQAPNIEFEDAVSPVQSLHELNNRYKLIVFGSGWCPKCQEEIPRITSFYESWKKEFDLEVVFISLDYTIDEHCAFSKDFPWISSCDHKGWEGKAARDYCVFGTPTLFLLDSDNKILLKPISPEQVQAWLDINNTRNR